MAQITSLQPTGLPGKIRTFLAKIASALQWREEKEVGSLITLVLTFDGVITIRTEHDSIITPVLTFDSGITLSSEYGSSITQELELVSQLERNHQL